LEVKLFIDLPLGNFNQSTARDFSSFLFGTFNRFMNNKMADIHLIAIPYFDGL